MIYRKFLYKKSYKEESVKFTPIDTIRNVRHHSEDAGVIVLEITSISCLLGYLCQSFWVLTVIFVVLLLIFVIPIVNRLMILFFSCAWGCIGYLTGDFLGFLIALSTAFVFFLASWKGHLLWFQS